MISVDLEQLQVSLIVKDYYRTVSVRVVCCKDSTNFADFVHGRGSLAKE